MLPAGGPPAEKPMTRTEMEAVVANATEQERWTNQLMPEKNWGTHSTSRALRRGQCWSLSVSWRTSELANAAPCWVTGVLIRVRWRA